MKATLRSLFGKLRDWWNPQRAAVRREVAAMSRAELQDAINVARSRFLRNVIRNNQWTPREIAAFNTGGPYSEFEPNKIQSGTLIRVKAKGKRA